MAATSGRSARSHRHIKRDSNNSGSRVRQRNKQGRDGRCTTFVGLTPGDFMQIQFPTSTTLRVTAVVRNRTGDRLGLEFLTQLPPDDSAMDGSAEFLGAPLCSCDPETLYAGLRRKQQKLKQVQREIEALHMAILLLALAPMMKRNFRIAWAKSSATR